MSILIKGMEMPKSCVYRENGHLMTCPLYDIDGYCGALHTEACHKVDETMLACPAVSVPTPHGRLIDADGEIEVWDVGYDGVPHVVKTTVSRFLLSHLNGKVPPTIIEAEEGE